ncbi:unnamed protein product [Closterium sp. NIES-54]
MRSAGSADKGGRAKSNWPDTPNAFQTLAPRKRDEPSPFSPWLARALLFLPGLATGFILGRLLGGSGKGAGGKKGELTAGGGGSSSGRKGGGGSAGGRSAPVFGGKAETEGAGGLVVGRGSELKMVLVVRQDLKMTQDSGLLQQPQGDERVEREGTAAPVACLHCLRCRQDSGGPQVFLQVIPA